MTRPTARSTLGMMVAALVLMAGFGRRAARQRGWCGVQGDPSGQQGYAGSPMARQIHPRFRHPRHRGLPLAATS